MSTIYRFSNPHARESAKLLSDTLALEKEGLVSRLNLLAKLKDIPEPILTNALRRVEASSAYRPIYEDNDMYEIGVSISAGFSWYRKNGFASFDDVQRFAEKHPGLEIVNEYGKRVTMQEFQKIAQRKSECAGSRR